MCPTRAARGCWTLGIDGAVPTAQRDRGFVGRDGHAAPTREARPLAGGWHVRNAAVRGRSCRPRQRPRPEPEHITWTGFTRDVLDELRQMDLFVLPSLFGEGLPMVVLEAMAAGVPVVATRVAGIPEAIRPGQDGVLVEPGDAEDLAER